MPQSYPLLKYRRKPEITVEENYNNNIYNFITGLWEDSNHNPLILKILENNKKRIMGNTNITLTRESIDKSESSSMNNCSTLITDTRETIDRSEVSNIAGGTSITNTRESYDKSEISNNSTLLTKTRESVDSSESSFNINNRINKFATQIKETRESTDRSDISE